MQLVTAGDSFKLLIIWKITGCLKKVGRRDYEQFKAAVMTFPEIRHFYIIFNWILLHNTLKNQSYVLRILLETLYQIFLFNMVTQVIVRVTLKLFRSFNICHLQYKLFNLINSLFAQGNVKLCMGVSVSHAQKLLINECISYFNRIYTIKTLLYIYNMVALISIPLQCKAQQRELLKCRYFIK